MSPGSLAFCLQIQFSFHGLRAVALRAAHISREEESREWGCRACPARVPVKLGTPGPPTLIGTGGRPREEDLLSRQVWISGSGREALSEPKLARVTAQPICSAMRPHRRSVCSIQQHLHSAWKALLPQSH